MEISETILLKTRKTDLKTRSVSHESQPNRSSLLNNAPIIDELIKKDLFQKNLMKSALNLHEYNENETETSSKLSLESNSVFSEPFKSKKPDLDKSEKINNLESETKNYSLSTSKYFPFQFQKKKRTPLSVKKNFPFSNNENHTYNNSGKLIAWNYYEITANFLKEKYLQKNINEEKDNEINWETEKNYSTKNSEFLEQDNYSMITINNSIISNDNFIYNNDYYNPCDQLNENYNNNFFSYENNGINYDNSENNYNNYENTNMSQNNDYINNINEQNSLYNVNNYNNNVDNYNNNFYNNNNYLYMNNDYNINQGSIPTNSFSFDNQKNTNCAFDNTPVSQFSTNANITSSNSSNPINHQNEQKKKVFKKREGDWICQKCKNLNFTFRLFCNRCNFSKLENNKMNILEKNDDYYITSNSIINFNKYSNIQNNMIIK